MKVSLHESTIGEDEIQAVIDVMRSGQVTSGLKVKEFEEAFPGKHAVMCNSGSSANLLAIAALCDPATPNHLKRGDGVIVSALSWSTTVWPLVQYGLIPIIVDIDPVTLNMDPAEVKKAVNANASVRAIMPVHVYGNPCDMTSLWRIAKDSSLAVIEDCCEALGAEYDMHTIGSDSQLATYSFYFSHHITTVEGGMVITNSEDLDRTLRILRSHGWIRDVDNKQSYQDAYPDIDPRFLFVGAGYNLRSTEMAAAMGLVQLPKLTRFVNARRAAAKALQQTFRLYEDYLMCQYEGSNSAVVRSSWFGFPIVIKDEAPFTAKEMREFFDKAGIETRPIILGNIARQPGMKHYPHKIIGDLANATRAMMNGLVISCHQGVDVKACDYIQGVLDKFMLERIQ